MTSMQIDHVIAEIAALIAGRAFTTWSPQIAALSAWSRYAAQGEW